MQCSHSHERLSAALPFPADGPQETIAPRQVGKYLVSALVKALANGWFASSVSIRSGSGSATTDRILRFKQVFRCAKEAAAYAHDEALQWISVSHRPLVAA